MKTRSQTLRLGLRTAIDPATDLAQARRFHSAALNSCGNRLAPGANPHCIPAEMC